MTTSVAVGPCVFAALYCHSLLHYTTQPPPPPKSSSCRDKSDKKTLEVRVALLSSPDVPRPRSCIKTRANAGAR